MKSLREQLGLRRMETEKKMQKKREEAKRAEEAGIRSLTRPASRLTKQVKTTYGMKRSVLLSAYDAKKYPVLAPKTSSKRRRKKSKRKIYRNR